MAKSSKTRTAKISSQMQVRIPRDLYERYGFGTEAEIVETKTGIEFRPIKSAEQICGDILERLVAQGLSGQELIDRFRDDTSAIGGDAADCDIVDF